MSEWAYGGGTDSPFERRDGAQKAARMADIAWANGWGNCMECAASSADKLHRKGVSNVEVMSRAGTHAFVVIDRDPYSDPADPSTWGNRAIIVDGWEGGEAYSAEQWKDNLPGSGDIESRFRYPDPHGEKTY